MKLSDFIGKIPDFSTHSYVEKIKLFAWYLHTYRGRPHFRAPDIRACFEEIHEAPPSSISAFFNSLEQKRPKEMLKNASGYRLERTVRDRFDADYAKRPNTVYVDKLLSGLPGKIPDSVERAYLDEALICFRNGAFRAAIVMSWNLAFDHICQFIISDSQRLADFNAQLPKSYPKADINIIGKRDDFSELKESQVLQVCKSAGLINNNLFNILKEKLGRRNAAAHPSGIIVYESTAEEFVKDLIENIVLKLV